MPYYFIRIVLNDKKVVTGVKENENRSIDIVYRQFFTEAEKYYKSIRIKEFDCFMISRQSNIYKKWIRSKQLKNGMLDQYESFVLSENLKNKEGNSFNSSRKKSPSTSTAPGWGENLAQQKVNKIS